MREAVGQPARASRAYGAGVALALTASLLLAWTTIVRDDGSGNGFFLVVMGAGVGGWATRFGPAGMARTMPGTAAMQAAFGLAVATAPVVANVPGEAARVLAFNGVFYRPVAAVGSLLPHRRTQAGWSRAGYRPLTPAPLRGSWAA